MTRSETFMLEAKRFIPGGVNSPARAYRAVGGTPVFFARGALAHLFDYDGVRYIDYVCTWGANILGHAHPMIIDALTTAIQNGLGFGAPTEIEIELAKTICTLMPNIEMVRMVNSGTEATMSAIRLARAFTKRDFIVKFEGGYHGHVDALLVKAGSGALTHGNPDSEGVPQDVVKHTLVAQYNDLESVKNLFEEYGDRIAAIIVEPVAGNMNCVPPLSGFLPGLRTLCDQYQSVLILDEVMTGFRVALGGAQAHYGIKPDLVTLGKVIGGGLPVGAFGGRADIMSLLSPLGPVYQAGTLSGNPIAMTAGLTVLQIIQQNKDFYVTLQQATSRLVHEAVQLARDVGFALHANYVCGMFGLFFTEQQAVTDFASVMRCDKELFARFFHLLQQQGVNLAPSAYEACFMSAAHDEHVITETLSAMKVAFDLLKE